MDVAKQNRIVQAAAAFLMATAIACQIFLLTPSLLYASNSGEFTVSLVELLRIFASPAVFLVASIVFISFFLTKASAMRFVAFLSAVVFLLWLQGWIFVWDYGVLDGRSIDWGIGSWRGWVDGAVWMVVLGGLLITPPARYRLWFAAAFVAIFAMGSETVSILVKQKDGLNKQSVSSETSLLRLSEFSATRNVVHIVMDGVQGDVFEEIINEEGFGRRLRDSLSGFTFFQENMGAFPYTHMSIPAILAGETYQNDESREEFFRRVLEVGQSNILNAAHNAGFEVDLGVASGLVETLYTRGSVTNLYSVPWSVDAGARDVLKSKEAAKLIDIALFRMVPHFFKPAIYQDQRWFVQQWVAGLPYPNLPYFSHTEFLKDQTQRMSVGRPTPVYKLFHLMLSHTPFTVSENCEFAGRVLPVNRQNVLAQSRCSLFFVSRYLERMKELGIYDSSTIVLMADHGSWVGPRGFGDSGSPPVDPSLAGLAVPVLAVKRPNAVGALRTSKAPSWVVDTARTVAEAAGIPGSFGGLNALDMPEDLDRDRFFHVYQYQRNEWREEFLAPIHVFRVSGSVSVEDDWDFDRTLAPGGRDSAD